MTTTKFRLNPEEYCACSILRRTITNIPATEDFLTFAINNQIAAAAGHILRQKPTEPNPVEQRFIEEHNRVQTMLEHYFTELEYIGNIFSKNGIKVILLKNTGIARAIFDCIGCCPMGDIDILVEEENFLNAHKLLVNEGYNFKFRSNLETDDIQWALRNGGSEYWKTLKTGEKLWLELQFRPVAGRWISRDQEPDAGELFERSIAISGSPLRLLSPEDNLLQVSLHTAKHSYIRAPGFRLHTDVDRIVRYQNIDWNIFLTKVINLKVKTAVYFSLLIPKVLLKTPVPQFVIDKLAPGNFKEMIITGILNRAGLFNPDKKKFNKITYLLFNILLYDSLRQIILNVFPSRSIMIKQYGCDSHSVWIYYLKRISDLLFRRHNT
jgi:hypothetical protein